MYVPAVSNTMTGGAAFDASAGLSVRGRCRTQTLSFASIAILEASPSFHCGGTFGHERSTSNVGRLRFCAYPGAIQTITKHTARTKRVRYIAFLQDSVVRRLPQAKLRRYEMLWN